ncbi:MAG: CHAD domain-containing protein [Planctomycetes bacterium]|nr:CHAD domain-containing protein [Planctomycetota bacterium]
MPWSKAAVTLVAMGKWVEVSDGSQPAAEVAAQILQLRMQVVQQMLPLAAHEYHRDIEHVHQLRVGCRRAGAALQAFRPLLRGKAKRLRKWLRKLRRAAGPARDADVLLERLQAEPSTKSSHAYLVARLEQRRLDVQRAVVDVAEQAETGQLDESVERCLTSLRNRSADGPTLRFDLYAREALRTASRGMFELAELEQPTVAQLHQLRIAGKRLRYSIELFHSAFPVALREEVYPLVEKIQSRLGRLNDHATAQALFQHWLTDLPPAERAAQLAERIVEEHEAIEKVRRDFLQWWTTQRVAALESHLSTLLHGSK